MAAAPAARGSGAQPARMAQEPRAEPARGRVGAPRPAEAGNDWVLRWSAIPDPLGGLALPLVMEVYGWLSCATSGTRRGLRNRQFDAMLLRRDRKKPKVPPRRWVAREDQGTVIRAMIRRDGPTRGRSGQLSWKRGRCSTSRTRRSTSGCPGPCAPPSATGATARGTRHPRSPSPNTNGGAGDS